MTYTKETWLLAPCALIKTLPKALTKYETTFKAVGLIQNAIVNSAGIASKYVGPLTGRPFPVVENYKWLDDNEQSVWDRTSY